jgi:hypothetical protein
MGEPVFLLEPACMTNGINTLQPIMFLHNYVKN